MVAEQGTEKSRAARPPKKTSFFLVAVIVFTLWKTLQVAGFCFSEARFLSDKELIARYLAGTDYDRGGFAAIALEQPNFGDCCRITHQPLGLNRVDLIGNAVVFNRRIYGIDAYLQRTELDANKEPYEMILTSIEACGRDMDIDTYAMPIDLSSYEAGIRSIRRLREGDSQ